MSLFCANCGKEIPEDSLFCENCGTPVDKIAPAAERISETVPEDSAPWTPEENLGKSEKSETASSAGKKRTRRAKPQVEPKEISDSIKLCPDGKYRWIYEFNMNRNPVIYFTILKVMAVSACFPAGLMTILQLKQDGLGAFALGIKVFAIVFGIFFVLSPIAYGIVSKSYGGKYIVLFEMDEEGVVHNQQKEQFEKAQALGWLMMMYGGATKSVGRVGQGILVSNHNVTSSDFAGVKRVIGLRRNNTIKINSLLTHNQVYVADEDYDFVWNFITSRCPNAKIR